MLILANESMISEQMANLPWLFKLNLVKPWVEHLIKCLMFWLFSTLVYAF